MLLFMYLLFLSLPSSLVLLLPSSSSWRHSKGNIAALSSIFFSTFNCLCYFSLSSFLFLLFLFIPISSSVLQLVFFFLAYLDHLALLITFFFFLFLFAFASALLYKLSLLIPFQPSIRLPPSFSFIPLFILLLIPIPSSFHSLLSTLPLIHLSLHSISLTDALIRPPAIHRPPSITSLDWKKFYIRTPFSLPSCSSFSNWQVTTR